MRDYCIYVHIFPTIFKNANFETSNDRLKKMFHPPCIPSIRTWVIFICWNEGYRRFLVVYKHIFLLALVGKLIVLHYLFQLLLLDQFLHTIIVNVTQAIVQVSYPEDNAEKETAD